jgi:hypothetical protein
MLQVAVLVSASLLEVAANFAANDFQSGTVRFLVHFALPLRANSLMGRTTHTGTATPTSR